MADFRFGFGFDNISPIMSGTPAPAPTEQPEGYDIFLLYGDSLVNKGGTYSNAAPPVSRTGTDIDRTGAAQWTGPDAPGGSGVISTDITPVWGQTGDTNDRIKMGETLARAWLDEAGSANRLSLTATMGQSGQALTTGVAYLAVGGVRYVEAVPHFNSALAAAKAAYPGSRFRGIIIACGSNDANAVGTLDLSTYQTALTLLCNTIRTDLNEGSELPILLYGPCPNVAGEFDTVRTAQTNVAAALDNVEVLNVTGQVWTDNLHGDAGDINLSGPDAAVRFKALDEPQKVVAFTVTQVNDAAVSTLTTSDAFMVRGIGVGVTATLTVSGGETAVASVDDPVTFGSFSSAAKTVYWGDMVKVRQTSSASNGATTTATVTITGPANAVSSDFNVVTEGGTTTNLRFRANTLPGFIVMNGKTIAASTPAYQER